MRSSPVSNTSLALFVAGVFLFQQSSGLCEGARNATGILRLARIIDPETLDPALVQLQEDFMLVPLLHLALLDVVGGTNIIPNAARSWTASTDKRAYTLRLRPGVRFSNGREVVAADYIFAMERIVDPANASMMGPYLKGIRGVDAFASHRTDHLSGLQTPSPDTLVIELDQPDPAFPYLLAGNMGAAVPPEEVARLGPAYAQRPVNDGPYVVKDWVRGARLQLEPNPYYSGPEPQHLQRLDIMIGGDETTHLMMFERGDLDIANINGVGIPLPSFRRIRDDPRWRGLVEYEALFNTQYIALNTEIPPLNNVLVRRALNHAINRDRWVRVATRHSTHSEGAIPPSMPGFNPALRGYDYNPDKARALLRESGVTLPIRLEFWHGTEAEARILGQGVQADLKQVGIDVDLKAVTFGELMQASGSRGKVAMCYSAWNVAIPDPVDMLATQFDGRNITETASMNTAFYNNSEVNRLLSLAAPEPDLTRRFARYRRAEELIVKDAPWVFMGHMNLYALRQPWLKGPLLEPLWWYRFDRVWIGRP